MARGVAMGWAVAVGGPVLLGAVAATTLAFRRLVLAQRRARRTADRITRLQNVTAALSRAVTVADVTRVVVEHACHELDAERGTLSLLHPDGATMRVAGSYGFPPGALAKWATYPLAARLPASDAARADELVVVTSIADRDRRYPELAGSPPAHDHALVCVPLTLPAGPIGAMSLSFGGPRTFEPEDERFLRALGDQCAQALERARLFEAERRSARREAFLAETSRMLAASLDYEATLRRVLSLLVPAVADAAAVHLWDGDDLRLVDLTHVSEAGRTAMFALSARTGHVTPDPTLREVGRTGQPVVQPAVPPETWDALADDRETLRLLRALDVASGAVIPLLAHDRPVGTLVLTTASTSGRRFTEADLPFLLDIGARAATAIGNARAHRERSELADTLQRSLLPSAPPVIPGLDLAAHYRPAGQGVVGGDFYDVFPLAPRPDGQAWGVLVGDVAGKGVDAAAVTALVRYTVRALARESGSPAAVLRTANAAILESDLGERFATMVLAIVEPDDRGARVVLASAGHPLPVLRLADGRTTALGTTGVAIGLFADLDACDTEHRLERGDALLFFTDGLLEARSPAGDFAPQLIDRSLRASTGGTAAGTVAAVVAAVDAFREGEPRDDLALLALAVPAAADRTVTVRIDDVPALLVVRAGEYVDELVRELQLVRLAGGERSAYPQRLLALASETLGRHGEGYRAARDAAEATLDAGRARMRLVIDLPATAAPAAEQFAALIDDIVRFSTEGRLLTLPPNPETEQFLRAFCAEVSRQLHGGAPARWGSVAVPAQHARISGGALGQHGPGELTPAREATTVLAHELGSAGEARRFLRRTLAAWGATALAAGAELPLSELVTNAVLHAEGEIRLVLRLDPRTLRVEVHDGSAVVPNRRSHDLDASTGRGLELVEALTDRSGIEAYAGGKRAWFEIATVESLAN